MIQPIKQFRVTRLTISGFKGYADQKTFQFGGMNVISGHKETMMHRYSVDNGTRTHIATKFAFKAWNEMGEYE